MPAADISTLRLATWGSALARRQALLATEALHGAGVDGVETLIVRTEGDRRLHTPIEQLEGQGWFTAELERCLLDERAEIAAHSAKDLPSALAPGLEVAAYLTRADPRDGVVSVGDRPLSRLPAGARVGTSSARRAGLIAALHPDLLVVPIRGNVDTRLRKMDSLEVDALVLACAGLDRLGRADRCCERLDPTSFVPSPAQGAIALEAVAGSRAAAICARVADPATTAAVTAERAVLAALGGGCLLPLGAWARIEDGMLRLTAALVVDGEVRRADAADGIERAAALGELVAGMLR